MTARAVNTPLSFFMSPQWEKKNAPPASGTAVQHKHKWRHGLRAPSNATIPNTARDTETTEHLLPDIGGNGSERQSSKFPQADAEETSTVWNTHSVRQHRARRNHGRPGALHTSGWRRECIRKKKRPGRSQIIRGRLFLSRKAELTSAAPRALRASAKVRPAGVRQTSYSSL